MLIRRKIKDFVTEGEAADGETIIRIRDEIEEVMMEDMRTKGYVPVIDLLPQLYWGYDKDTEHFNFSIIIYGTYVGKRKAREIMGILDSRPMFFEQEKN
jgi:hypothetical protein